MLVLSRKVGERIMIGDNVIVTVVNNSRGSVSLGIEAPREVAVNREEIAAKLNGSIFSAFNKTSRAESSK